MSNTVLLNKISQSFNLICQENRIDQIKEFNLVVSENCQINEDSLREYLEINNNQLISDQLRINIQYDDLEEETAIIHSVQGDSFE